MLIVTPILVVGLALFLAKSRLGIAVRGSADNPEAARLAGVFEGRASRIAWAMAGGMAAFGAILLIPARGYVNAQTLGPGILLRALLPAVIARLDNLVLALISGVGVGIVESVLLYNQPGGLPEAVLFVLVIVALFVQRRRAIGRTEEKGAWAAIATWPPLHESLLRLPRIRHLGKVLMGTGFAVAMLVGLLATNATDIILTAIVAFSIVGLSVGLLTGLGGELTFGQWAIAGVGAVASAHVVLRTGNFVLGFGTACLAGAAMALLLGYPAIRIRGLTLAVSTLAFALAAQAWIFSRSWAFGDAGLSPGRPRIGSLSLQSARSYYVFSLVLLLLVGWLAHNAWSGGFGRRLRALRDNEGNARAFTVAHTRTKLQAFAVAGALAGLGGALFGHLLSNVNNFAFGINDSINLVAMAVIGGLGLLAGPILGALYIIALPRFVHLDAAGLAATSLGWLLFVLYVPAGIPQLVRPFREKLVNWLSEGLLSRVSAEDAMAETAAVRSFVPSVGTERPRSEIAVSSEFILEVSGLTKRYGGVTAVDGVSFAVAASETLGVIGPNGAGKTTLFELIGGFTRPDAGFVRLEGQDITSLPPERRGRLGLVRSFQDASLFPTLTVLEAVQVARERLAPTRFLPALIGRDGNERRRLESAREIVHLMGLDPFRHKRIAELSTGTRRIAEIACMIGLEPKLLLLDEPSSGVAQRETEKLGELLAQVKTYLETTLIVIEHDMPLIMGLSDRIIALETGRKIAEGPPEAVQKSDRVIESYLGRDLATAARAGELLDTENGRCRARTRAGASCSRTASDDGLCAQHRSMLERQP